MVYPISSWRDQVHRCRNQYRLCVLDEMVAQWVPRTVFPKACGVLTGQILLYEIFGVSSVREQGREVAVVPHTETEEDTRFRTTAQVSTEARPPEGRDVHVWCQRYWRGERARLSRLNTSTHSPSRARRRLA